MGGALQTFPTLPGLRPTSWALTQPGEKGLMYSYLNQKLDLNARQEAQEREQEVEMKEKKRRRRMRVEKGK